MIPLSHQILASRSLLLAASAFTFASCERMDEKVAITETRQISKYESPQRVDIPSATRFFDNTAEQQQEAESGAPQQHPLVWTTPEGWKEKPSSQMRLIDMSFGLQGEGECYLAALPGPAGGLAANINRWRAQVGAGPLTDEEIEKLPRKDFLGRPAHFISVDGAFKGMGDEASAKQDYRLVGLIHQASELTLFIKMTGPKELMEQNMAQFDAFCASIKFRKQAEQEASKGPPQE